MTRLYGYRQLRWNLDEVFVRINGERYYPGRAVDQEGALAMRDLGNLDRHLVDRQAGKSCRSVALAEWQTLQPEAWLI